MRILHPAVYILASKFNGTLYTGVSSNLIARIYQHKNDVFKGFTHEYGCKILVYYEVYDTMEQAILREKQIKSGSRDKKIQLINSMNPEWHDLYDEICK